MALVGSPYRAQQDGEEYHFTLRSRWTGLWVLAALLWAGAGVGIAGAIVHSAWSGVQYRVSAYITFAMIGLVFVGAGRSLFRTAASGLFGRIALVREGHGLRCEVGPLDTRSFGPVQLSEVARFERIGEGARPGSVLPLPWNTILAHMHSGETRVIVPAVQNEELAVRMAQKLDEMLARARH